LRLSLFAHDAGAAIDGPHDIVYDVEADAAHVGPAQVAGRALVWTLSDAAESQEGALLSAAVDLDPATDWIMRCDRIDFVPGGIAYRHTHPGPGIRCLLFGRITIDSEGAEHTYGPGEPWFERGPDPVLANTHPDEPSAFARVMLLPAGWAGKRTISYVDPADAEKPKTQRPTVFLETPVRR
jgi:quercetin dioxygenase-like cupin family protein